MPGTLNQYCKDLLAGHLLPKNKDKDTQQKLSIAKELEVLLATSSQFLTLQQTKDYFVIYEDETDTQKSFMKSCILDLNMISLLSRVITNECMSPEEKLIIFKQALTYAKHYDEVLGQFEPQTIKSNILDALEICCTQKNNDAFLTLLLNSFPTLCAVPSESPLLADQHYRQQMSDLIQNTTSEYQTILLDALLAQNRINIYWIGPENLLLTILKKDPSLIKYVHPMYTQNTSFSRPFIKLAPQLFAKYPHVVACKDYETALTVVSHDGRLIKFVDDYLKQTHLDLVIQAIKQTKDALNFCSKEILAKISLETAVKEFPKDTFDAFIESYKGKTSDTKLKVSQRGSYGSTVGTKVDTLQLTQTIELKL